MKHPVEPGNKVYLIIPPARSRHREGKAGDSTARQAWKTDDSLQAVGVGTCVELDFHMSRRGLRTERFIMKLYI